jgi:predicted transcriptional regulator
MMQADRIVLSSEYERRTQDNAGADRALAGRGSRGARSNRARIEARRQGVYHATPDELRAIDEALASVERGELASNEEVEAVFAKYRRA